MMQSQLTFDSLLLGLDDLLRAGPGKKYPRPALFQQACNVLAGAMPSYPRTFQGFLILLEQPLRAWWPWDAPDGFDADSGLTYEGDLGEEASRYFYEELCGRAGVGPTGGPLGAQRDLENREFQKLMERLQSAAYGSQAQQDYVLLRSFLIEHADTTRADITAAFAGKKITPLDVGKLYEDAGPRDVWTCDRCGPLREKRGQPRGLRPSVCDEHDASFPHVHRLPESPGRCRVRIGIHWRTTLPGLPEMALFHALEALHQECPRYIREVQLWPGVDRYDLRVEFGDGKVWAVDVKDHRDPGRLAQNLTPLYGEGRLRYDECFYVFPLRRLQARHDYLKVVREEAAGLPAGHGLMSDSGFRERVAAEVKRLLKQDKKGEKTR